MFLSRENLAEVLQGSDLAKIPDGGTGYHLGSQRAYSERSRLKRVDRRGEILVCRNQLTIELREVSVTLRRGPAGPGVFVLWCSMELVLADPAALAAGIGSDRTPRRVCEVERELHEQLCDLLRSLGEEHDLTTKIGQTEVHNRILPDIAIAGYQVKAVTFRRVLTGGEFREEKTVWAEFQNGLERLLHDEEIWMAAERNRLQQALVALEGENVRALLTEQEKMLEAERRVERYVELFPGLRPARHDQPMQLCPHPHCRSDLSISQTFVCGHCQNTLHTFHRSPARPAWCDECYKTIAARRRWFAVAAAVVMSSAVGIWAATMLVGRDKWQDALALHWYAFGHRGEDSDWQEFQVHDGMTMYSGDRFRVNFSCTDNCYVYMVNVTPDGKVLPLFPNPAVNLQNPCCRGQTYEVPDGINFFVLDDTPGVESIFLIASLDPLPDLEAILKKAVGKPALSRTAEELSCSIRRFEQEIGAEPSGKLHSGSGVQTRAVLIQSDQRLAPTRFKTPEFMESAEQAIRGISGAVQRIQFSHQDLPKRNRKP